jgi:hypothetical protein
MKTSLTFIGTLTDHGVPPILQFICTAILVAIDIIPFELRFLATTTCVGTETKN